MNDHELDFALDAIHQGRAQVSDPPELHERAFAVPLQSPQRRFLPPISTWRFQSMFSATKFVVAGVIVALFGGFLLSGVLTQQPGDLELDVDSTTAKFAIKRRGSRYERTWVNPTRTPPSTLRVRSPHRLPGGSATAIQSSERDSADSPAKHSKGHLAPSHPARWSLVDTHAEPAWRRCASPIDQQRLQEGL
jgi:hypothetical protein